MALCAERSDGMEVIMQEKLINYTNDILKYIQEIPLSDNTVRYYHVCYNSLIEYCKNSKEDIIQMTEKF